MERESTKHGGRLDEEMKSETRPLTTGAPVEGHSRDDRVQEDMPEDAELVGGSWRADVTAGGAPDPVEIEARAELARRLAGLPWPASRGAIADRLRTVELPVSLPGSTSGDLLERITDLSDGPYDHFQAFWEALRGAAA